MFNLLKRLYCTLSDVVQHVDRGRVGENSHSSLTYFLSFLRKPDLSLVSLPSDVTLDASGFRWTSLAGLGSGNAGREGKTSIRAVVDGVSVCKPYETAGDAALLLTSGSS